MARVVMVHALGGMRGPARTLSLLAPAAATAWDVTVAAPTGYLTSALAALPSIRVVELPLRGSRPRSWVSGSSRLMRLNADGAVPDIFHANGLSALNLAAPSALRFGRPVFVHFHGSESGARARALARLWIRLGARILISPVSDRSRSVLAEAGLGRWTGPILPNPVAFPPDASGPIGLPVRVGFIGSPSPKKGLHLLVELAIGLADSPGIVWEIAGIDPGHTSEYVVGCRRRLEAAGLADRVSWLGPLKDPERAYAQMDILLVPSLRESWCRVAMEGMAAGLPVVGTAIPGLSELLERVDGALTFPPERPDIGRRHVLRLAADPELCRSLGRSGREAMRSFDVRPVCEQLLGLYEGILEPSLHVA